MPRTYDLSDAHERAQFEADFQRGAGAKTTGRPSVAHVEGAVGASLFAPAVDPLPTQPGIDGDGNIWIVKPDRGTRGVGSCPPCTERLRILMTL